MGRILNEAMRSNEFESLTSDIQEILTSQSDLEYVINNGFSRIEAGLEELKSMISLIIGRVIQGSITIQIIYNNIIQVNDTNIIRTLISEMNRLEMKESPKPLKSVNLDINRILLINPHIGSDNMFRRTLHSMLSHSLGLFIGQMESRTNLHLIGLYNQEATKDGLKKKIQQNPYIDMVIFLGSGHPNGDRILGYDENSLMDNSNVYLCKNKGLYFLCNYAAKVLGKLAVDNGARFFFGFEGVLNVSHRAEMMVSTCIMSGLSGLLKGDSPQDALRRMQIKHEFWINELETKQEELDPDWFLTGSILKSNKENLILII